MLTTLLSSGQSSRLQKALVDNTQKAVNVGAFPFPLEDPGLFLAYAISNVGVDANELEATMQLELDKVKNELITEKEFQKLQNQIENSFVSSNSTVAGIANSLCEYHVMYGNTELINLEIEKYMNVTKEDIKNVANKYLNADNRVVLHYLAKSKEKEN